MKKYSEEELIYIKDNYKFLSYKEIGLNIGRTAGAVKRKVYTLKLPVHETGKNPKSRKSRKYTVNDNFFSEPTLLNSYWAGFLAADGYIQTPTTKNSQNKLSCMLASKDIEHLHKLKKDLSADNPIWEGFSNGNEACSLTITSNKLCRDLKENFNISPQKSFTYKLPKLERHLFDSFFIGLIDGDGAIGRVGKGGFYIDITCNTNVAIVLKNYIKGDLGLNCNYYKHNNVESFRINDSYARSLFLRLYKIEVPKLKRKWRNEYEKYCKNYEHPHTKISNTDYEDIYNLYEKGLKQKEIAEMYDVHQMTISRALRSEEMKKVIEEAS